MSVIRKDFPDIVREILTDVAIASHPSAMTAFLSVKALWDTGATFSVISRDKVAELGDLHLTNNGKTVFKFAIPPESNKDDQAP